jgi:hypothetical protein
MGKIILASVFGIALCWAVGHLITLGGHAFSVAGVSVSTTMIVFMCGAVIGLKLAKK